MEALTAHGAIQLNRRRSVLIIEDNKDTAYSLRLVLESHGHEVRVAYTGPDGVRVAIEEAPDAVICDIGLPGLDGFGVVTALRAHAETSAAYAVAVTSYSCDEIRRRCYEAGFDRYFTKPVDPDVLLEALADAPRRETRWARATFAPW